jgi:hypothetical protein
MSAHTERTVLIHSIFNKKYSSCDTIPLRNISRQCNEGEKRQRREQKRQRQCDEETKQDKVRRSNIMIQSLVECEGTKERERETKQHEPVHVNERQD